MTPPGNCAGLEAAPSWDTASSVASLVTILCRVGMVSLYLITIVTVTCRGVLIMESFTDITLSHCSQCSVIDICATFGKVVYLCHGRILHGF